MFSGRLRFQMNTCFLRTWCNPPLVSGQQKITPEEFRGEKVDSHGSTLLAARRAAARLRNNGRTRPGILRSAGRLGSGGAGGRRQEPLSLGLPLWIRRIPSRILRHSLFTILDYHTTLFHACQWQTRKESACKAAGFLIK